jgi:hypothetical protein
MEDGEAVHSSSFVAREGGRIEQELAKHGVQISSWDVIERWLKATADFGQESHRGGGADLVDLIAIFEELDQRRLQPLTMVLIQGRPK